MKFNFKKYCVTECFAPPGLGFELFSGATKISSLRDFVKIIYKSLSTTEHMSIRPKSRRDEILVKTKYKIQSSPVGTKDFQITNSDIRITNVKISFFLYFVKIIYKNLHIAEHILIRPKSRRDGILVEKKCKIQSSPVGTAHFHPISSHVQIQIS